MTIYERVKAAMNKNEWASIDKATTREEATDALIVFAYQLGRHEGVREASDMADKRYAAQKEAASKCRYHKMALDIVENAGAEVAYGYKDIYTYHPDYSGDLPGTFGGDKWPGDDFGSEVHK